MKTDMKLAGNVLDEVLGLSLDKPGSAEAIVNAVEKRLTELGQESMIHLCFSKVSHWNDEEQEHYSFNVEREDESHVSDLYGKLAALRALGFEAVDGHAS